MKFFLCVFLSHLSFKSFAVDIKNFDFSRLGQKTYIPLSNINYVKKNTVKRGQGLYQALKSVKVPNNISLSLINALRDEVEFSKLKVGDNLEARFDAGHNLLSFSYSQNPAEKHIVSWNNYTLSWDYSFKEENTHFYKRILSGELKAGSTLQQDLLGRNLNPETVNEIVQILLCKVNFRMYARRGDQYKILLKERIFEGKVIGTKVLYTSYKGVRAGHHESYFYEDSEKGSTYTAHYSEKGQALINAGLRYPLKRLHVRSNYGWRRHPVTGRRAMHRGVDLRGRRGEPVRAVASGKVILSTYNKFAGNKVGIRHKDGSSSYYYHLTKRGVKKGQWVRSHQLIGTVGATGRVTGPHLHFGFKTKRGKWMNPLNKRMIATPKLKGERFKALSKQVTVIKNLLIDLKISKEVKYLLAKIPNLGQETKLN